MLLIVCEYPGECVLLFLYIRGPISSKKNNNILNISAFLPVLIGSVSNYEFFGLRLELILGLHRGETNLDLAWV